MSDKPYKDPGRGQWTSASNAESDLLCPGRHVAQLGLPDVQGEWADQGNAIHEALCTKDPSKLTLEQHEVYEACHEIEVKAVEQFFGPGAKLVAFRERRWLMTLPVNETQAVGHSGKSDLVVRSGAKALIVDYKSLSGQIAESPRNMQLRDLAVLFRGNTVGIEQIGVLLIQPLVTHSPEIVLYEKGDLDRAEKEMVTRVIASNNPQSPRRAGESQCKYCKAKKHCVEYTAWSQLMLPAVVSPAIWTKSMAQWSPEDLASAADMLPKAGKILDEIKDFLKSKLEADPASIPGWHLAPGAIREAITDPQKAFERFVAMGGTLDGFMTAITVVKSRLKESVAAVTGNKGKALEGDLKTLCEGITEKSQNSPSLKRKEEA